MQFLRAGQGSLCAYTALNSPWYLSCWYHHSPHSLLSACCWNLKTDTQCSQCLVILKQSGFGDFQKLHPSTEAGLRVMEAGYPIKLYTYKTWSHVDLNQDQDGACDRKTLLHAVRVCSTRSARERQSSAFCLSPADLI